MNLLEMYDILIQILQIQLEEVKEKE
jgi:hypothetical protein